MIFCPHCEWSLDDGELCTCPGATLGRELDSLARENSELRECLEISREAVGIQQHRATCAELDRDRYRDALMEIRRYPVHPDYPQVFEIADEALANG